MILSDDPADPGGLGAAATDFDCVGGGGDAAFFLADDFLAFEALVAGSGCLGEGLGACNDEEEDLLDAFATSFFSSLDGSSSEPHISHTSACALAFKKVQAGQLRSAAAVAAAVASSRGNISEEPDGRSASLCECSLEEEEWFELLW